MLVTPVISGTDFRVVLAPAISVGRQCTLNGGTLSAESVLVCGWSLEFNVVTDVDCFLNKNQVCIIRLTFPIRSANRELKLSGLWTKVGTRNSVNCFVNSAIFK